MERQLLALVEDQVGLLVERDFVLAEQQQFLLRADALELLRNHVRIDAVRPLALEPAQHGLVGAMAAAGVRERAEQFGAHARDLRQHAALVEPARGEARRRAHRPDRMRRRRTDADFEQIEDADGHWR